MAEPPVNQPIPAPTPTPEPGVEEFDPREYLLDTGRWAAQWPTRAVIEFEDQGFKRVRLEQIEPHPCWTLQMRCEGKILTAKEASSAVLKVVLIECRIPRGGFMCSVDRRGVIRAGFVLNA
jgi:hypothetical protein